MILVFLWLRLGLLMKGRFAISSSLGLWKSMKINANPLFDNQNRLSGPQILCLAAKCLCPGHKSSCLAARTLHPGPQILCRKHISYVWAKNSLSANKILRPGHKIRCLVTTIVSSGHKSSVCQPQISAWDTNLLSGSHKSCNRDTNPLSSNHKSCPGQYSEKCDAMCT